MRKGLSLQLVVGKATSELQEEAEVGPVPLFPHQQGLSSEYSGEGIRHGTCAVIPTKHRLLG